MKDNRSEHVRAWLAKQKQPATALQITHALEPFGDVAAYSSLLSAMEKRGMVRSTKLPGLKRQYMLDCTRVRTPRLSRAHTGRAERIRALLQGDRGYTVAEVRAAVDPQATSNMVSASLFQMAKQGQIHRAARGAVSCYGRTAAIAQRHLAAELARRAADKPAAAAPRKAAAPTPKPKREPKPAPRAAKKQATKQPPAPPAREVPRAYRSPPPPSPAMQAAMDNSARPAPRPRPVPVTCGLSGVSEQQQLASERIAADIAAFQAKGGRIERLGPTQFFTRIGMEAANTLPLCTPRTGTYDLDD